MGGIVGSIVGGVVGSGASKKAAKINAKAQADNRAFATDMYNKGAALVQPTINRGTNAASYVDGLLGIGGDTAQSQNALNTWRNSVSYQDQVNEGQNQVLGNAAARGSFQSGATAKALQDRAISQANQSQQTYINNLTGITNQGLSATNALLGQQTNLTNNVTNANNSQASSSAANALAQGQIFNKTLDNIASSLSSSFKGGF